MNKTWYQSLWYWRLAFFECLTDSFIAGAMCWISAVANADWNQINPTARATIVICTIVAMLKVVKSFLSTTIQVLKDNQPTPDGVVIQQQLKTIQTSSAEIIPHQQPPSPAQPEIKNP
jgi:hypothetical protein